MSYQEDYDQTMRDLKAALEDLRQAESRAVALQRRAAALHVLIVGDNPQAGHTAGLDLSLQILRGPSRPVDQLRRIFAVSSGPLTNKELRAELRQAGCDLADQSNPAGTINALCSRLVEQGVIRRTEKAGKNAWEKL
jgi:hypothetical protein